jgi:transcriptional regulator with XRE-family HTH domain
MKNTKPNISKLRVAREARGFSQEKAAVLAGISVCWLRQLERDPSLLTPRIRSKLLPVLGMSDSEAG